MAIQNTFYLDVDIKRDNYVEEPQVTQNDDVAFVLRLTDDGVDMPIAGVSTYTLASLRADGQSVLTVGTLTGPNEVTFELGSTEVSVPGRVKAAIQLYDVDGRVSSLPFTYEVTKDLATNYVPSKDEQTLIELVLGEGPVILAEARQATADSIQATSDLTVLKTEVIDATANANTAASYATTEGNRASTQADRADTAATNAEGVYNAILPVLPNIEGWGYDPIPYDPATTYEKNNIVSHDGSTYISLLDGNVGNTPTLATPNANWGVLARRGIDGKGAVSSVNGVGPDASGDVTLPEPDLSGLATKAELQTLDDEVTVYLSNTKYEDISRVIYVKTNGSDGGDGSLDNPFRTITKALSTVNKNISSAITIRVFPGDYRSEGNIFIKNYRGSFLMITAYDGNNEVILPSDSYLVDRITMYDSEAIYLQGFKCHPNAHLYGVYMSNCRFVKINGYKNESIGSSGLGCTGNSFIWIENSTANNLSTVISANHGATVVSQNWINSLVNDNGIIADVGSKIHLYDDNQPLAHYPRTQRNSGVIFNKDGVFLGGEKKEVTTFLNSWSNMNEGYEPLSYWKDGEGCIHVQGVVDGGASGSAIFNLPEGFRPNMAIDGIGTSGNSGIFAAVRIYPIGDVQHLSGGVTQLSINLMFKP